MRKVITVFGSSIPKEGEPEFELAYNVGKSLAEKGFDVCTGGNQGIMNAVSKGAYENGGKAIGVTVKIFNSLPSKYLSENIVCETLPERIEKLINIASGYIILDGGTGTLLELAYVWELINKDLLPPKPVACNGITWKPIVDSMNNRLRIERKNHQLVKYFDEVDGLIDFIVSNV